MTPFTKAIKRAAKLRLALCGPAGSGKTYSLLALATELGGPIAYVDTEHGSASKYADLFSFDVSEPDTFDPRDLIEAIGGAAAAGYNVICIDSLSHYWMGTGGELDMVDSAAKKSQSGNSFAAWKHVTPIHNKLVDTIIAAPIHVLVSMRTKTEWVVEKDDRGKTAPRKIGLAPVMRDGIEFEFDVCGDLDQDNNLVVTKSRCPELSGQVINRPGKAMGIVLKRWLSGAEAIAIAPVVNPPAIAPVPAERPVPEELRLTFERVAQSPKNIPQAFQSMGHLMIDRAGPAGEEAYSRITKAFRAQHPSTAGIKPADIRECLLDLWDAHQALPAAPMVKEVA
jgi:DNA polymerase III delta prime subunit